MHSMLRIKKKLLFKFGIDIFEGTLITTAELNLEHRKVEKLYA